MAKQKPPSASASQSPRLVFPQGFLWGAATAALQIEGATREGGRGSSVWDTFCREHPESIHEREGPEIACDHYHRVFEDVGLISDLGHNAYRFSIAWPRLFPDGSGGENPEGFAFYDRLIDWLLERRIEPFVTLYHWDLPQPLGDRGGWETSETIGAFTRFATACFRKFGDRVRNWVSINEPAWTTFNGYITGLHPPCRQDPKAAAIVATNFLIAHARAAAGLRESGTGGKIGLALNMSPVQPASETSEDLQAARLADALFNRWFFEPPLLGTFPEEAWDILAAHGMLPSLTAEEESLLRKPCADFLGVNYYYPHHVSAHAPVSRFHLNTSGNAGDDCLFSFEGLFSLVKNPSGRYSDWAWEIAPDSLYQLLMRLASIRPDLPVYVTENGIGLQESLSEGTVDDTARIEFVRMHLEAVHRAIASGSPVRGYFMWSLMDNFSWLNGFKKRYGFLYVDRKTLTRTPKKSAAWFREVARRNAL